MGVYKVRKYKKAEDYLDPNVSGQVIVSGDTWEEAEEWRDHYQKECPDNYYNITHTTAVATIEGEE